MVELFGLFWDAADDLFYVRLVLVLLLDSELVAGGFGNFEKGVAGHLHDARELLFHELEELFDDCAQEGPVIAEEGRVLAHDVHYA